MLTLISPAKTLDYESPLATGRSSKPSFLDDSSVLIDNLRPLSSKQLSKLMGISDKLADLNRSRYESWETPFTKQNARQALLAFKGDVYQGLEAESFSDDDFLYSQQHLRILSGLYGVLRPLDLMMPYRLEMGTRLKTDRGNNLYDFWGESISRDLNKQLGKIKSSTIVNLASNEYFKSVDLDTLDADVVAPVFLDEKNGTPKVISFYAKKARGVMTSWIMKSRIERTSDLKKFKRDGYRYSASLSEKDKPAFVRKEKRQ
ncbi:MAG: peroxide stress protein YaaA [Rhodothermales bacterium]|nr:peroxide stress protein YaaA [Rhodothermales bacterium]